MEKIDISGEWRVTLEKADAAGTLIHLPGCTAEKGLGDPIGPDTKWVGSEFGSEFKKDPLYESYRTAENYKYPYWLQPETRFVGKAFYERDVELPGGDGKTDNDGKLFFYKFFLERCHWKSTAWLDGELLGESESLCVPHVYVFRAVPGHHTLRICIDNSLIYDVGPNAHSMSDQTQGSWNGIVGRMEITRISPVEIEKIAVYPDIVRKSFVVKTDVINRTEKAATVRVGTQVSFAEGADGHNALKFVPLLEDNGNPAERKPIASAEKDITVSIPPFKTVSVYREVKPAFAADMLWDELNPSLLNVAVTLSKCGSDDSASEKLDEKSVRTGLRELSTEGHKFFINGRPFFLRGTLECCIFPKTGYPPCTAEEWHRIYRVIKDCGLNHIRFHSWCPPEAAFAAADEDGVYLQVECPLWKNQGSVFDGNPAFTSWLFAESERIVDEYGNHPSFILFNSGNEPDGCYHDILGLWTEFWKQKDGRRLYNASSCWPVNPENDFEVNSDPRLQQWGEELKSTINALPPETCSDFSEIFGKFKKPAITHEMGQWCVFPDFDEMSSYTGYLKPRNYEVFADILKRRGLSHLAKDFLEVSGKHQLLCYKEEVEKNLRTEISGGFQLLGLSDFPGQGTALVGVLNVFWKEKGYCTKADFHAFCGSSVLLCLMEKRVFTADEDALFKIRLYRYEKARSQDKETLTLRWYVTPIDAGAVPHTGDVPAAAMTGEFSFSAGSCGVFDVGEVSVPLEKLCAPCGYTFTAGLVDNSREVSGAADCASGKVTASACSAVSAKCRNSWNFWVYPEKVELSASDIYISDTPDEKLFDTLEKGGKALLLLPPEKVSSDVKTGFSSVFWNTSWTDGQGPHTLGVLCKNDHPVFRSFPTENWADWQWWYLMHDASSMVLDDLPQELNPIVQPVDTWFRSHKLALLFECAVGNGRLVVASSALTPEMVASGCAGVDSVRRQYLYSILEYMKSSDFKPAFAVNKEDILRLVRNSI